MKKSIENLIAESSGNLDEFTSLMLDLQNEFTIKEEDKGEQISKGMNPLEKSDDEKEAEQDMDQPMPAAAPMPGGNVAIGNKDAEDAEDIVQKPTKVEVSGKSDTVEMDPQTKLNDDVPTSE
jgi:hypothetical protein